MNKKNIRVSDAIPEMPLSFDRTVEQTLRRVCSESKQTASPRAASAAERSANDDTPNPRRKHWFSKALQYAATAAMLVAILAVGGILVKSAFRSTSKPAAHAPSTQTAEGNFRTVERHRVSILLLPDLDDAERYAKAREDAQQPAFSEEDWGWIRKIGVSIEDITVDDRSVSWTTVFSIPPEIQPKRYSQNPFSLGMEDGLTLFGNGAQLYYNGVAEDLAYSEVAGSRVDLNTGTWYVEETTVMSRPESDVSGIAEIHQQFRIQDSNVDPQQEFATVAVIEQSFSFDMGLFSVTPQPEWAGSASVTPVPETPDALVPAIRCNMLLYTMSDVEFAGEIDESAITGRVSSIVPLTEWPQMHGEANFGKIGMPYAETENGLVVLFENEWRLFEPVMPDPSAGVIDAACAQALAERKEIEDRYRQKDRMTEQQIGELDGEANFIHQRLVKLMNLWAKAISVEQTDGRQMRLSQIAFDNGKLYFAFAAPRGMSFDEAPVIRLNGQSLAVGDESGFIGLRTSETEHYAFCSVCPDPLQKETLITVENGGAFFCFRYLPAENRVKLPSDAERTQWLIEGNGYPAPNASPEPPIDGVSYYYLVNGVPVYPYENFLYEDKDGLAADGMSIRYQLEDEKVRRAIPKELYDPDASFGIAVTDGWKLMEFAIFDSRYNRIGTVGRADLKETEPGVYSAPEQLKTLSPGIYYLNAIVAKQDGGASRGNELVICLNVGGVDDDDLSDRTPQPTPIPPQSTTPAPKPASTLPPTPPTTLVPTPTPTEERNPNHIPMICYHGEVYGLHDEIRPDAPDADAASGTVTSVVSIGEIPETDGQANFGSIGMQFYVTRDGLVVWYNSAWRLFVAIEFGHES